jgi:flagellar basal body-associated protein FliL
MPNETSQPPKTVSGKWLVIILVPVMLVSFAWLAYARLNFTHPTALSTKQATSSVPK